MQSRALQDAKLRALGDTLTTMWNNQVELSKSETRLDEQFCVLARLSIRMLNDILVRIGSEDLITEKVIETAFKEWATFKERSDFREFMVEWFLGKPLSELPPAKEEPLVTRDEQGRVQKINATPVSPGPKAEGPQEFGGDYGTQKRDERNEAAPEERQPDDRAGQEDAMPAGQDTDRSTP